MAEVKPSLIDSEARARATGGKEMRFTECGNVSIPDYMKIHQLKTTEDLKNHLVRLYFQPERLSEKAPEKEMRQSEPRNNA